MITVYDNFFDEDDFLFLQKKSDEIFSDSSTNCLTNYNWSDNIVKDSNVILVKHSEEIEFTIKKIIAKKYDKKCFIKIRFLLYCIYYIFNSNIFNFFNFSRQWFSLLNYFFF